MGLFDFFKSDKEKTKSTDKQALPWRRLQSLDQLTAINKASNNKTQVIFKHSTRCGISKMVLRQFEDSFALTETDLDLYYLDLLNNRDISNEISAKFQVMHQSPQLLVLKKGKVVHHASHHDIQAADLVKIVTGNDPL